MDSRVRRLAVTAAITGMVAGSLTTHVGAVVAAHSNFSGTVSNPYSPAYGHPYRHGVVPTIEQDRQMKAYEQAHPSPSTTAATGSQTLSFGGGVDGIGVTSGRPRIYLVFWGTQWGTQGTDSHGNLTFSSDTAGGAPYIQNLFKGLGTSSSTGNELWSGVMTQYCDGSSVAAGATSCPAGAPHVGYPTGGALAGVWYDNSVAEPSAASGHQIGQEAVNAAAHFGNTSATLDRYAQYDILSPKGLNPDNYKTGRFCAWHDYNGDSTLGGGAVSSSYGDIAFTNMPYVMDAGSSCGQGFVNAGGTLDGYSIVNGHEYAETVTDQNPAGGWTNASSGKENGDECAWISSGQGASADVTMSTGNFAMQSTWSNDTNRCDISHAIMGGTGGNDFSIGVTPNSLSIAQGNSGTSTISTAVTSGSAATVSLSASVSPTGPTASLSPTSVSAGGSSTLTVSAGASVTTGNYTVTVTGTEGTVTHTTTVTVTVTSSSGGGGITNGGFETGTFSGWTVSGTTSIVTSGVHSGSYAAQGGSTSPSNGDSSTTQTFTVPSGKSLLTFWYDVICPDSVAYDWATATLKDNTTGAMTTPLGKTCVSNSGWVQVSAAVTAGHSYTLTLSSHDDNYPGDPTYTHFDDAMTS